MAGLHILWRQWFESDISVEEVCHLYKPSSKKSEVGYFLLAPWEKKKILMANLSSSCEGWKDKNFWVGGNFDPEGSISRTLPVPRVYQVPGEFPSSQLSPPLLHVLVLTFGVLCRFLHPHLRDRGTRRADQHRS